MYCTFGSFSVNMSELSIGCNLRFLTNLETENVGDFTLFVEFAGS